jgi:hypothetical protein
MSRYYTVDARREMIYQADELRATLDGQPAVIRGAMLDYAQVTTLAAPHKTVAFAWATVAYILAERAGQFRS